MMTHRGRPHTSRLPLTPTMRMTVLSSLLASLTAGILSVAPARAESSATTSPATRSGRSKGRIKASFTAPAMLPDGMSASRVARPDWVEDAHARSLAHLERRSAAAKSGAVPEYRLRRADLDDLGQMHLRLEQLQNGVQVFGGELVAQLDGSSVLSVTGREFRDAAAVDTTPTITPADAAAVASAAMPGPSVAADASAARLVILPNELMNAGPGATLCFLVELMEGGDAASHRHLVFVDARDGHVVWDHDTTRHAEGRSLYSGTVEITTRYEPSTRKYLLQDDTRGGFITIDVGDRERLTGPVMTDGNDVWGNYSTSSRQSAGVDAHYGVAQAWDYFLNTHGWYGLDNQGRTTPILVHYGTRYDNAFWNGSMMVFGDGDGVEFGPFVPVDIVGHEYMHGVNDFSANLVYSSESGALDESYADIFGTAIEPDDSSLFPTTRKDYQLGEDCITPGTPDDALRNLADPTLCTSGRIDHYSNLRRPAPGEAPGGSNDNGYVHSNSGIQNKAFFLLAEGGTHPVSNMTVEGIGRGSAELIFFRALTQKLFRTATFADSREATLSAATDLFGHNSPEYRSTAQAWASVGVGEPPPSSLEKVKLLSYASYDGSGEIGRLDSNLNYQAINSYPPGSFMNDWSSIVGGATDVFHYRFGDGIAAVVYVDAGGGHNTAWTFPAGRFYADWSTVLRHEGSLVFYSGGAGVLAIGRLEGETGYKHYGTVDGLSLWWTHIVSVQGRLLFYNSNTGQAAYGDLEEVYDYSNSFPVLTSIGFRQSGSQMLSPGWSNIVDTGRGILFYNTDTGVYCFGDLTADGSSLETLIPPSSPWGEPMWTYTPLDPLFSHVVMVGDVILFYNLHTGQAMKASVATTDPFQEPREPLVPGDWLTMQSGWTHLVTTVDPLF